jgi:hypothetical protein
MLALMAGEDADRRARWADSQAKAGRVKLTTYVPADVALDVKDIIRHLRALDGPSRRLIVTAMRAAIRDAESRGTAQ